jgi:hypothetical protein
MLPGEAGRAELEALHREAESSGDLSARPRLKRGSRMCERRRARQMHRHMKVLQGMHDLLQACREKHHDKHASSSEKRARRDERRRLP